MQIQKREAPLKTKFFLSMSSLTTSVTVLLLIIMSFIFYGHFFSVQAESSALQLNAVNKQLNFYLDSLDNYSRMMISDTRKMSSSMKIPEGTTRRPQRGLTPLNYTRRRTGLFCAPR